MRRTQQKGFTIVELIIVVSVIAILAGIVILSYGAWRTKIATDTVKSDLSQVAAAMENARTFNDEGYPTSVPTTYSSSSNVITTPSTRMGGGSYCVVASSTTDSSIQYYVSDKTPDPKPGNCDLTATLFVGGVGGYANATGAAAQFNIIEGLTVAPDGTIFATDRNNVIRKITTDAVVTTYAGTGVSGATNGPAATATFQGPRGLALDPQGNLYATDINNNSIRMITPGGVVSNFGPSTIHGTDIIRSERTGFFYALDGDNFGGVVWKISPAGVVTRIAGSGTAATVDGQGLSASFNDPRGLALDAGENIFVCENGGTQVVRKVTQSGVVTTYASSLSSRPGGATSALNGGCNAIAIDQSGTIYIATNTGRLQTIEKDGTVKTLLTGISSQGLGLAFDTKGNLWYSSYYAIHKITIP